MVEKVHQTIEKFHMLEQGDHVVAGVSGGADSVALLMILLELQKDYALDIIVVHINHLLREAAKEEERYVRNICERHHLVCKVFEKDMFAYAKELHCSTEEAGRIYRYQCFQETAAACGCTKLAVAHHMNDRIETMLFHMVRGTGLKGMQGIPPIREMLWESDNKCSAEEYGNPEQTLDVKQKLGIRSLQVIRPLYEVRREEIEEYLTTHQILYYTDESNQDIIYSRNRIRNRVIPELNRINTQAVSHMAELSERSTAYWQYVEQQAIQYETNRIKDHRLVVSELLSCPELLRRHIIYRQLIQAAGRERDIEEIHVESVLALLSSQGKKRLDLPYQVCVVKTYDQLCFYTHACGTPIGKQGESYEESLTAGYESPELPEDSLYICRHIETAYPLELQAMDTVCSFSIEGIGTWSAVLRDRERIPEISKKNYTKVLNYDRIEGTLYIRNPQAGDYMVIDAKGAHKKLSRILIDQKVPQSLREQLVVVADGSHVIWIPGIRISETCKITENTRCVLRICLEPER